MGGEIYFFGRAQIFGFLWYNSCIRSSRARGINSNKKEKLMKLTKREKFLLVILLGLGVLLIFMVGMTADSVVAIVATVALILSIVVLYLNAWKIQCDNILTSCSLVVERIDVFTRDADMQRAFYRIEDGEFKSASAVPGSIIKKETDKLLRNFAIIARMKNRGLITLDDVQFAKYYIVKICENEEIKKYFQDTKHPYKELEELARELSAKKP